MFLKGNRNNIGIFVRVDNHSRDYLEKLPRDPIASDVSIETASIVDVFGLTVEERFAVHKI